MRSAQFVHGVFHCVLAGRVTLDEWKCALEQALEYVGELER
jgi:hypothetical protein